VPNGLSGMPQTEDDGERPSKHTLRLPRFIVREPIGVGNAIKRVTSAVGVKPCGACEERATHLNQWMTLGAKPHRGARR
jgi:hypothetical protein